MLMRLREVHMYKKCDPSDIFKKLQKYGEIHERCCTIVEQDHSYIFHFTCDKETWHKIKGELLYRETGPWIFKENIL